ncbi:PqiA/YebS family transporter subunit [Gallaecimonas sp. GXIMD4217]|uniref:PqiA/YebS family transporter subunit n=1 Tax=Gallaecimonas sp. GXIMD4217 TaxID=3131927 RepID=UPI00311B133E
MLDPRHRAWCPRCQAPVAEGRPLALRWLVALAGVLLFCTLTLLAQPMLHFGLPGQTNAATLMGGILSLAEQGQWLPSFLVFLTGAAAPTLLPLLLLYTLFGPDGYMRRQALSALCHLREWCMLDVLLVGLCVSLVKLVGMAELQADWGLATLVLGQLAMAGLIQGIRPAVLWQRIAPQAQQGLAGSRACPRCHALNVPTAHGCWRCHHRLESRPAQGKALCWALLAASTILLVPANVLPISYLTAWGATTPDTIFSGVLSLVRSGYPIIAVIVFVASIVVPVGKILILSFILLVHDKGIFKPVQLQKLYRLVAFIGRWSMLDIFVMAIMVTLIQQGLLSEFRVGPAATPFAMVVVLTMLAAGRFDTRWLWMKNERQRRQEPGHP